MKVLETKRLNLRWLLIYGREVFGLKRIVAITAEDNYRSARLLEKLGLRFECMVWSQQQARCPPVCD